ncbi:MAG TPA: hypothetical protein VLL97_10950 [Acidobacteriota bacterium]|nr:hypothetical protein [Acidobacteriota bacterium]
MPKILRRTPEEYLEEAQAGEAQRKGRLKIFLGYASGVGKSFRMLDEARRRRERGQDVVVGAVQPRVGPEVQKLLDRLEVIPLAGNRGATLMDVEAIKRRRPAVCIIDGIAYNNPPGSLRAARWEDARELVQSGIKVIASINIQYIDELREQVEAVTGKHVVDTVPVSFIKAADEIQIVDAPPEEPIERSPEERINAAVRQQQLSILREMALVLTADVVDYQLSRYLESHGIRQMFGAQERILVCLTPRSNARVMIETARAMADSFHAELIVAYMNQSGLSSEDQNVMQANLATARGSGAAIEILEGEDPAGALLSFARSHGVTQLFIGHTRQSRRWPWKNPVERIIRLSQGMDVRIFPQ